MTTTKNLLSRRKSLIKQRKAIELQLAEVERSLSQISHRKKNYPHPLIRDVLEQLLHHPSTLQELTATGASRKSVLDILGRLRSINVVREENGRFAIPSSHSFQMN